MPTVSCNVQVKIEEVLADSGIVQEIGSHIKAIILQDLADCGTVQEPGSGEKVVIRPISRDGEKRENVFSRKLEKT